VVADRPIGARSSLVPSGTPSLPALKQRTIGCPERAARLELLSWIAHIPILNGKTTVFVDEPFAYRLISRAPQMAELHYLLGFMPCSARRLLCLTVGKLSWERHSTSNLFNLKYSGPSIGRLITRLSEAAA